MTYGSAGFKRVITGLKDGLFPAILADMGAGHSGKHVSLLSGAADFHYRKAARDASDSLLVVPEHTWGGDVKVFWPDYAHYTAAELCETENEPGRKRLEASWEEKRRLLDTAEKALGVQSENVSASDPADTAAIFI